MNIKQQNNSSKKRIFLANAIRDFFLFDIQQNFKFLKNCIISITNVVVLDNGNILKIYISCFAIDKHTNEEQIFSFLNKNIKKIRFMFGQKMAQQIKFVPIMQFYIDDTKNEIQRINELCKKIH